MALGDGGDGSIIALFSEGGIEHIRAFLERLGLKQFEPAGVKRITTEEGGTLRGWLPYKIGREPFSVKFDNLTAEAATAEGFVVPALPGPISYNEESVEYERTVSSSSPVEF